MALRWHSFTKLLDFTLVREDLLNQNETSAPYGYGNDLQNWPRHIAQIVWRQRLAPTLTAVGSVRLHWGFQGARDYAEYNTEVLGQGNFSRPDEGRTQAFRGNASLNLGLLQRLPGGLRLDAHAYNVLGWVLPNLNKRNTIARMDEYRIEAPALSLRLGYAF